MGALNSIFSKWFGSWRPRITLYMGAQNTKFNREAYEHACVRAIIDCIATHTAKAEALHVVVDENNRISKILRNSPYAKLLNIRPNELMSGYDLRYKLISQLESNTTAILYVKWRDGKPEAIYPVNYRQFQFAQAADGSWAVLFTDSMGAEHKLPMEDCVVLRKYYNNSDVYGDGNGPVYEVLDTLKAADSSFAAAVEASSKVRFLHKKRSINVSPLDKTVNASEIGARLENARTNGGIIEVDASEDLTPFYFAAQSVNAAQMKEIRNDLLTYWRMASAILQSNYTEQEWQGFYESIVEPRLLQMGLACTNVCFTQAERDKGNRILYTAPMLLHASMASKTALIQCAKEIGLFTINEQREMLGYPPVEGGDKREVSLNYVSHDKQDKYQTGEEANEDAGAGQGDPVAPV